MDTDENGNLVKEPCNGTGKESPWTREALPTDAPFEKRFYFVAEKHRGDWYVWIEDLGSPNEFKPNVDYWRRSRHPIEFPPAPEED